MLIPSNKKELKWLNQLLQRVIDIFPGNISVIDPDCNLVYTNLRNQNIGIDNETLTGEKCFKSCVYIDRTEDCFARRVYATGDAVLGQQVQLKNGRWVDVDCLPMKDDYGKILLVVEFVTDVTHYQKSMERWQLALTGNQDGIWDWHIPSGQMFFSNRWLEILGHDSDELEGNLPQFSALLHPADIGQVMKGLQDHMAKKTHRFSMEYRMRCADGKYKWIHGRAQAVWDRDGTALRMTGTHTDISDRKANELEIIKQTLRDDLTGLYNRIYFDDAFERLDTERMMPLSVILGDVNGLQTVNEIFGRLVGDQLVCKIADILRQACRKEDIISSWGGENFAILLHNTAADTAYEVIRRIEEACRAYEQDVVKPSLSMGAATKTSLRQLVQDVLLEAEDQMHRKQLTESRSSYQVILESLEETINERFEEAEEHARRLKILAYPFGKLLKLSPPDQEALRLLCVFHDVGKIAIPDSILTKNGLLTLEEWHQVKTHPEIGSRIAKASPQLKHIADYILHHQEWWNGTGYPSGRKGRKIPKLSRILALIDAYDVMTHERTYRKPMSHLEALNELKKCSGSQFDPEMVKAFLKLDWDDLQDQEIDEGADEVSLPATGIAQGS